jgi:hypothetical protein
VRHPVTVEFEAEEGRELRVPNHRIQSDGHILPVDRLSQR